MITIRREAAVYLWLACLLVLLPLDWLLCAFFAAIIHEVCHVLILLLFGGRIRKIDVSVTGCMIETSQLGYWQAMFSILAGPAGSMLLLVASETAPKIAACGFIHGLYNLLPILPLDGGRILQLLLYKIYPENAESVLLWTGRSICAILLLCVVYISINRQFGVSSVLLILTLRLFPRKISCKPYKIGLQ